jgi:hypothetical protein
MRPLGVEYSTRIAELQCEQNRSRQPTIATSDLPFQMTIRQGAFIRGQ